MNSKLRKTHFSTTKSPSLPQWSVSIAVAFAGVLISLLAVRLPVHARDAGKVKLNCTPVYNANAGIARFEIRTVRGKRVTALVEVNDFGQLFFHGWVRIRDRSGFKWEREIDLSPGQTKRFIAVFSTGYDEFHASLTGGPDYLKIDNSAMATLPDTLVVGWVGEREPAVLTLLAMDARVRLEFIKRTDRILPGMFDLVIINDAGIPPPPGTACLVFGHGGAQIRHPLPAPVSRWIPPSAPMWTGDLHISLATTLVPGPNDQIPLTDTLGRPLILIRGWRVIIAFSPRHSDFVTHTYFAAFLDEVLQWATRLQPGLQNP